MSENLDDPNVSTKVEENIEQLEEGENEGEATTSAGQKQKEAAKAAVAYIWTRNVSDNMVPYVGMLAMAIVQVIAISTLKLHSFYVYGLVLGIVTIVLSVTGLILILMEKSNHKKENDDQPEFYERDPVVPGFPTIMKLLSYFLLPWNFIGTCIMTLGSTAPFNVTSNGYFSSWGVVVFSIMAVGITLNTSAGTTIGSNFQIGLLLCCFLVFFDSFGYLSGVNSGEAIYALILSIVTAILIAVFLYLEHKKVEKLKIFKFSILLIFAIMWFFEACFATFGGPFTITGNGYFGSWGGALASALLAKNAVPARKGQQTNQQAD